MVFCLASWNAVEQSLAKLGDNVGHINNNQLRSQLEECINLVKR